MMEAECVVCGSVNDYRSIRCFVCGAELPPQTTGHTQLHGNDENYRSFQALNPPINIPLSVGALPLEEILSRRPNEQSVREQAMSGDQIGVLLGPEELDLSPLPVGVQSSSLEASTRGFASSAITSSQALAQEPSSTWIGIPSLGDVLTSSVEEDQKPLQEDLPLTVGYHKLGSEYSPISSLLEEHQRKDVIEPPSSLPKRREPVSAIELPRQKTLTGAELKQIEVESTSSSWGLSVQIEEETYHHEVQNHDDLDEPLNSQDEEGYLTGETALKISIPDLLAINTEKDIQSEPKESALEGFVPISSLSHAKITTQPSPSTAERPLHQELDSKESTTGSTSQSVKSLHTLDGDLSNKPQRPPSSLSLLSWLLLAVSSITVGIVIALYMMPIHQSAIQTSLKVTQITKDKSVYRIQLTLSAKPDAQLLIPDSYIPSGQSPLIEVKGTSTVELEVPKAQMRIGGNLITLQWLYQETKDSEKRTKPVEISIPIYYQRGESHFSSERDGYLLPVEVSPRYQLTHSNQNFEPTDEAHHYEFFISSDELKARPSIDIEASLKDASGHERFMKLSFTPPHESIPLRLLSPVNRYARPDQVFDIIGQTSPRAAIQLISLSANGLLVDALPKRETKADEKGYFELPIPLESVSSGKEGTLWRATVSSLDLRGKLESQDLLIKQSYRPTWNRYIKRLSKRRERALSRYRRLSLKNGEKGILSVIGRARTLSGTIAFIDRGDKTRPQRLLIHTCRKDNGCPVWVEDKDAFWVKIGERVSIFGVVIGMGLYPSAHGTMLSAPEVRSRLTTPGAP